MTSHSRSFSSCKPPAGPSPAWPPFPTNDSSRLGPPRSPACFGECVCACTCWGVVLTWNDERLHCQLVSNLYMLFVCVYLFFFLRGGVTTACCALENSTRLLPALGVFLCTFITVKKWMFKSNPPRRRRFCQPWKRPAGLNAAFYCFSQRLEHKNESEEGQKASPLAGKKV